MKKLNIIFGNSEVVTSSAGAPIRITVIYNTLYHHWPSCVQANLVYIKSTVCELLTCIRDESDDVNDTDDIICIMYYKTT